jgi:hypothetical protein
MTTDTTVIKNLLARKQQLVQQLDRATGADERDQIEQQVKQIDIALDALDPPEADLE